MEARKPRASRIEDFQHQPCVHRNLRGIKADAIYALVEILLRRHSDQLDVLRLQFFHRETAKYLQLELHSEKECVYVLLGLGFVGLNAEEVAGDGSCGHAKV